MPPAATSQVLAITRCPWWPPTLPDASGRNSRAGSWAGGSGLTLNAPSRGSNDSRLTAIRGAQPVIPRTVPNLRVDDSLPEDDGRVLVAGPRVLEVARRRTGMVGISDLANDAIRERLTVVQWEHGADWFDVNSAEVLREVDRTLSKSQRWRVQRRADSAPRLP